MRKLLAVLAETFLKNWNNTAINTIIIAETNDIDNVFIIRSINLDKLILENSLITFLIIKSIGTKNPKIIGIKHIRWTTSLLEFVSEKLLFWLVFAK